MPRGSLSQLGRVEHCIQRAWERYGLEINEITVGHIDTIVTSGRAGVVNDYPTAIEAEVVFSAGHAVGGVLARVVYLRGVGTVTFLPPRKAGSKLSMDRLAVIRRLHRYRKIRRDRASNS